MGGSSNYLVIVILIFLAALDIATSLDVILTPHPNATYKINELVTFNCSLLDTTNDQYTIEWYLDNEPLIVSEGSSSFSIRNDSKSSELELLGAVEYDLLMVTCVATPSAISNRSTLLILQREIDECIIDSQDSTNICFACVLTNEIEILKLLYHLSYGETSQVIFQDNITTSIGNRDVKRCITIENIGTYKFSIYVLHSFIDSTLNNPSFVISQIIVEYNTTDPPHVNNTATMPPSESDTNILLSLQSWEYGLYVYIGAGFVVFILVLILLAITICTVIITRRCCRQSEEIKDAPLDLYELPSKTVGENAYAKTSSMSKTTVTHTNNGSTVTTSQHMTVSHSSANVPMVAEPVLAKQQQQDGDNSSVESIYDRLYDTITDKDQEYQNTTFTGHVQC